MRSEKLINVDVATRAQRARERVGTNGQLQEAGHITDAPNVSWFSRVFTGEDLIVNGRQVKGFVVPHWAAGVLLAALVSAVGFMYSQINSQRDMLIEMKTELRLSKEHDAEARAEIKEKLELQQIYINEIRKENQAIRMVLTPAQLRTIERTTRRSEN